MINLLSAHLKKTRRTSFRLIVAVLPVLYSTLLFLYYFAVQKNGSHPTDEYRTFFLFLTIAVQFTAGIMIVLFIQIDKDAGNFGNELRIGVSRFKLLTSKFLFQLCLLIFVEILATSTFYLLQAIFRNSKISTQEISLFLFVNILLMLPILIMYLWSAYQFDLTGTVIVGIIFTLSGILMGTTNLGGSNWIFLPPTWGIKAVYELVPTSIWLAGTAQHTAHQLIIQIICVSLAVSIIFFAFLFVWYNKWEGKRNLEE